MRPRRLHSNQGVRSRRTTSKVLATQTQQLIATLNEQEQIIVRAVMAAKPRPKFPWALDDALTSLAKSTLSGVGEYQDAQIRLAARKLKLPPEFVALYHNVALAKLRHGHNLSRREGIDYEALYSELMAEMPSELKNDTTVDRSPALILHPSIETIRRLTPELIQRLKNESENYHRVDPFVFEHLVAELLAAHGFADVRLVGRNPQTSADIFAVKFIPEIGDEIRYFVEVKRHRDRIGVNVIDRVYGAMQAEQTKFGWRGSIIVTSHEFKDFRKYTREALALRGILLRDKRDLFDWIDGYKPSKNGLWVPPEYSDLQDI